MNTQIPVSKRPRLRWLFAFMILLAACTPGAGMIKPVPTLLPAGTQPAAATQSVPTALSSPTSTKTADETVEDLVQILEVSDPASPTYAPDSAAYIEFPQVVKQLAAHNASTNNAASMLGYALGFPRPDSILAARALLSLGPDWAATELPALIDRLQSPRPEVRMYALIVLGITGENGSCSLGNIGPRLWDADPFVRTSAALAVQGITGKALVPKIYWIDPGNLPPDPVAADTPEGKISASARTWWTDHGAKVNWHPSYDLCDP
jgi:hypothetical protein